MEDLLMHFPESIAARKVQKKLALERHQRNKRVREKRAALGLSALTHDQRKQKRKTIKKNHEAKVNKRKARDAPKK